MCSPEKEYILRTPVSLIPHPKHSRTYTVSWYDVGARFPDVFMRLRMLFSSVFFVVMIPLWHDKVLLALRRFSV